MTELLQTLVLSLLVGGIYALVASGLTLIFGVIRVINIAHGAYLILGGFITYTLWNQLGLDPLVGVLITTPVVFALGWLIYRLMVRPIRHAPMSSTVLLTCGTLSLLKLLVTRIVRVKIGFLSESVVRTLCGMATGVASGGLIGAGAAG